MRQETRHIGFACLVGAFIGAMISLDLAMAFDFGKYFWPIGTLIGGAVGYLTYRMNEIPHAIAMVYRKVVSWRPDVEWWKDRCSTAILLYFASFFLLLSFMVVVILIGDSDIKFTFPRDIPAVILSCAFLAVVFSFLFVLMTPDHTTQQNENLRTEARSAIKYANPILMSWWVVYYSGLGAIWIVRNSSTVWAAVRVAGSSLFKMVWQVFVCIHSQERVLCMTDAAIGATIGFFAGSAIIGAIAGCVCGVINYELISICWLKLARR